MITLKFSNKTFYTLTAIVLILFTALIVSAAVNKNQPWHPSTGVEVNIGGTTKSLQEAIDAGDLTGNINNVPISTGLYGHCIKTSSGCLAKLPATCVSNACRCPADYALSQLGYQRVEDQWGIVTETYWYSCYKN